jgi:CRP/FNR family transcriptional regulator, cyclic AMP receptor protein
MDSREEGGAEVALDSSKGKSRRVPKSKLLKLPIRARSADGKIDLSYTDYVLEVEKERVYLKSEDPLPVGTRLHFAFDLPGVPRPIYLQGEVVRINSNRPDSEEGLEPGMGIVFDHIRYDDRHQINEYLEMIESDEHSGEYSTFLSWIQKISMPMSPAERDRIKKDLLKAIYGSGKDKEPVTAAARRKSPQEMEALAKIPLFAGMDELELDEVARIALKETFGPGDIVFPEGATGDKLYLILEGQINIVKMVPGKGGKTLITLKPGDYFGEMALIDEAPRSAGAVAEGAATLLAIKKPELEALLDTSPAVAAKIYKFFVKTLNERLRVTNDKIKQFAALAGGGEL